MNKSRILALANHIESLPEGDFSMVDWIHPCGTPQCVAGHAVALFRPARFKKMAKETVRRMTATERDDWKPRFEFSWSAEGAEVLGISRDIADSIFFANGEAKDMAARLRRLAE